MGDEICGNCKKSHEGRTWCREEDLVANNEQKQSDETAVKRVTVEDVKRMIEAELPAKYWMKTWHRFTQAGIEVGINHVSRDGSRAALLPIGDELRPQFAKWLAADYLKYETRFAANENKSPNDNGDQIPTKEI